MTADQLAAIQRARDRIEGRAIKSIVDPDAATFAQVIGGRS